VIDVIISVITSIKINPNPPIDSKVIKVFLYTHLRSLNVHRFGMAEATKLKICGIEVTFNGSTNLQNLLKIHQSIQKLLVGDTHTHRQTVRLMI
jgi:hypothetical protein